MLVALNEQGERINAWEAERKNNYYCPECEERVILKKGQKVIAHFAHFRRVNCDNKGESYAHLSMKKSCYLFFEKRYEVELEKKLIPERRTDLALRNSEGKYVAVEVQYSPITVEELTERTKAYNKAGIPVLWIFHASRLKCKSITQAPKEEVRIPEEVREYEYMTNFVYAMDDLGEICECKLYDAETRTSEWYAEGEERYSAYTPETLKSVYIKRKIENPELLISKYYRMRRYRGRRRKEIFWLAKFKD